MTHSTRRPLRVAAAFVALATAATLTACSSDATAGQGGATASADDPFKALVITNGPENDKSWSNSVYDGVMAIDDPSIEVSFIGSLTETSDIVQQASAYASEGYDMIVISNGAQAAAATQLAEQFPDTTVCQGPWSPTEDELAAMPENQCVWNIKQQDGTFLAGVVAGLVTKTNKLASVAGGEFPAVIRQPEGFILGARCVNPEATIDIQYTGSFDDVAAAQSAATTQVADGADVILSAVDGAVSGLYGAARDAASPTYVIPSYYDSFDSASDVVLTSVLYNLGGVTADMIVKGAAGEIEPHAYLPYTYANLEVGELADFHGNAAITPEIQTTLEDIQSKLRDGTITVPDEVGAEAPLSVPGSGSTIDPASIGC